MIKKNDEEQRKLQEVEVITMKEEKIKLHVLGVSGCILNKPSAKAKQSIIYPRGFRNTRELRGTMKHDPYQEFQDCPYKLPAPSPTLLALPSTAFKKAMGSAAFHMPGTAKTETLQMTWVFGEKVPIWGIPKMFMAWVRNSDIRHNPDIRTRVMLGEWCSEFWVSYVPPSLSANVVTALMGAAGLYVGVGDGRQEKGTFSYGRFRVVTPDDTEFQRIKKYGGRKIQELAMKTAEPYDDDTRELYDWFKEEVKRRNFEKTHKDAKKTKKTNGREISASLQADEESVTA